MANKKNNEAYDLSLFEPAEKSEKPKENNSRKNKNNIIKFDSQNIIKAQRRKKNPIVILGVSLLTIVVAAVSITIVQSNVILNELNGEIINANKKIDEQNNLAAQYQLKVDSKLSAEVVQEYAETELNMTKAQNAQKNFISLSEGDFGEVIRDDDKGNVLETIADAFTGMWS